MICVVDYGMGNLRSVAKALEHAGGRVVVTSSPDEVLAADRLVLPGVGAFGDGMKELISRNLREPVVRFVREKQRPFLGICLGLQLLLDSSEESPGEQGLALIPGRVMRFDSRKVKVPHMGWNQAAFTAEHSYFQNIPNESYFYFVHSYFASPKSASDTAATTEYNGVFSSVLVRDNIFATQFHPEKSQETGLQLLKNFVES